jgi:hypothetical protein
VVGYPLPVVLVVVVLGILLLLVVIVEIVLVQIVEVVVVKFLVEVVVVEVVVVVDVVVVLVRLLVALGAAVLSGIVAAEIDIIVPRSCPQLHVKIPPHEESGRIIAKHLRCPFAQNRQF